MKTVIKKAFWETFVILLSGTVLTVLVFGGLFFWFPIQVIALTTGIAANPLAIIIMLLGSYGPIGVVSFLVSWRNNMRRLL